MSSNGRYVTFYSIADNLVPGDLNGVADVFVAPNSLAVNAVPVITSNGGGKSAAVSVAENTSPVLTTITATDVDGDAVQFSLTGADALRFTIDAAGELRFNSTPDFEAPTDAGGDNVYNVTVVASDAGGLSDTHEVAVTVTDVNEAPVITSNGGGETASVSIEENSSAVTTVTTVAPAPAGVTRTF